MENRAVLGAISIFSIVAPRLLFGKGNLVPFATCGRENALPENLPVHHGRPKDGLPPATFTWEKS